MPREGGLEAAGQTPLHQLSWFTGPSPLPAWGHIFPSATTSGSGKKAMVCLGQGAIWSRFHLGVVHLGSLPAAGAWVVAWLGAGLAHSSDFLGLGNRSCWAQGHFELAQGPPLLSPYRIQRRQTHFSPFWQREAAVWQESRDPASNPAAVPAHLGPKDTPYPGRACLSFHLGPMRGLPSTDGPPDTHTPVLLRLSGSGQCRSPEKLLSVFPSSGHSPVMIVICLIPRRPHVINIWAPGRGVQPGWSREMPSSPW